MLYTLNHALSVSSQASCGFLHCVSFAAESRTHALKKHARELLVMRRVAMAEEFCTSNVRTAVEIGGVC